MQHPSHLHPLIFKDAPGGDKWRIICSGCLRVISPLESVYGCDRGICRNFILHKECAELPMTIMHPFHESHSLFLSTKSPYRRAGCICNKCSLSFEGFTYHCSDCKFDLDVACAIKDSGIIVSSEDRNLKHEGHEHPLVLHSRPALFMCDACGIEDKDLPYVCLECPFWIHNSCAKLPKIAKCKDHPHHLTLGYRRSRFENIKFSKIFTRYCSICTQKLNTERWLYSCEGCHFYVHIKCSTFEATQEIEDKFRYDLLDDLSFEKRFLNILLDNHLFCLPVVDKSVELIGRFLLRKNSLAQIEPEIKHWSHKQHPLILFHEIPKGVDGKDEEILCDCCIEPILALPYYSCVECNYFLHLPCAKLPKVLHHPTHPHSLTLNRHNKFYDFFSCSICFANSNGFFFECKTCNFFIDVKCAALPISIQHIIHNHPLFQFKPFTRRPCSVCKSRLRGVAFGCESCIFCLCYRCAMLPREITHRSDEHPLALRIPPYTDPSGVFYCVICEKEMDSTKGIHHCFECDNSYHMDCVPRFDQLYRNIKFGGKLEVSFHEHPLMFVQRPTLELGCTYCAKDISEEHVFECEDCNIRQCLECILKLS